MSDAPLPLPARAYGTFSLTVRDYGDEEINRMAVAYEALALLPLRCLEWLTDKIILDHRSRAKRQAKALSQR